MSPSRTAGLDFGAVLVKPSHRLGDARIPLVVFIHGLCYGFMSVFLTGYLLNLCVVVLFAALGGPHSQFPAEWNCTTSGLVKLGFAVLMGEICVLLCQAGVQGAQRGSKCREML